MPFLPYHSHPGTCWSSLARSFARWAIARFSLRTNSSCVPDNRTRIWGRSHVLTSPLLRILRYRIGYFGIDGEGIPDAAIVQFGTRLVPPVARDTARRLHLSPLVFGKRVLTSLLSQARSTFSCRPQFSSTNFSVAFRFFRHYCSSSRLSRQFFSVRRSDFSLFQASIAASAPRYNTLVAAQWDGYTKVTAASMLVAGRRFSRSSTKHTHRVPVYGLYFAEVAGGQAGQVAISVATIAPDEYPTRSSRPSSRLET